MTINLTKGKLAAAVFVIAVLAPTTALAVDSWSDTPDGAFYHDAVTWAKGNGMTTGCNGGTGFCPDDGVTRGENITFAKRYDDIVVQPFLPIAVAHLDADGSGTVTVTGTAGVTAIYDTVDGHFTVSVDGHSLTPSTHAVQVTSIRINSSAATEDRSASTFFSGGDVEITVWDDSSLGPVINDVHVTIYELETSS